MTDIPCPRCVRYSEDGTESDHGVHISAKGVRTNRHGHFCRLCGYRRLVPKAWWSAICLLAFDSGYTGEAQNAPTPLILGWATEASKTVRGPGIWSGVPNPTGEVANA